MGKTEAEVQAFIDAEVARRRRAPVPQQQPQAVDSAELDAYIEQQLRARQPAQPPADTAMARLQGRGTAPPPSGPGLIPVDDYGRALTDTAPPPPRRLGRAAAALNTTTHTERAAQTRRLREQQGDTTSVRPPATGPVGHAAASAALADQRARPRPAAPTPEQIIGHRFPDRPEPYQLGRGEPTELGTTLDLYGTLSGPSPEDARDSHSTARPRTDLEPGMELLLDKQRDLERRSLLPTSSLTLPKAPETLSPGEPPTRPPADYGRELAETRAGILPAQPKPLPPTPAVPLDADRELQKNVRWGGGDVTAQDRLTPEEQQLQRDEDPLLQLARGTASGAIGFEESVGTVLQYMGNRSDLESLAQLGDETADFWEAEHEKFTLPESLRGNIIDRPELLRNPAWLAYMVGEMGPSLSASIAPAVGAARVITIGGRALRLTPEVYTALAHLGGAVAGGVAGGALEGTNTYREVLRLGGTEQQAARAAEMMLLASGALNAISVGTAVPRAGTAASWGRRAAAAATEGVTEYLEEPAEAAIKLGAHLDQYGPAEAAEQARAGLNVMLPAALTGGIAAGGGTVTAAESAALEARERDRPSLPEAVLGERAARQTATLWGAQWAQMSEATRQHLADAELARLRAGEPAEQPPAAGAEPTYDEELTDEARAELFARLRLKQTADEAAAAKNVTSFGAEQRRTRQQQRRARAQADEQAAEAEEQLDRTLVPHPQPTDRRGQPLRPVAQTEGPEDTPERTRAREARRELERLGHVPTRRLRTAAELAELAAERATAETAVPRETVEPVRETGVGGTPVSDVEQIGNLPEQLNVSPPKLASQEQGTTQPITADSPAGTVGLARLEDVHVDAPRFQYKLDVDKRGVRGRTPEAWDEGSVGVIDVWRDPADGKLYVTNGHHRFAWAQEHGRTHITVRLVDAKDAAEARTLAALTNVRQGRGNATDAAKLFRELGVTERETLRKAGVLLTEAVARDGLALSKLPQALFDATMRGELEIPRAAIIGGSGLSEAQQLELYGMLRKQRGGKEVSDRKLTELIKFVKNAPELDVTQESLFGEETLRASLAMEKADVSSGIKRLLLADKAAVAGLGNARRAAKLAEMGVGQVDPKLAKEIRTAAEQMEEMYDQLSIRTGPVADALNDAARQLAQGGDLADITEQAYSRIRPFITAEIDALTGKSGGADATAGPRVDKVDRGGPGTQGAAAETEAEAPPAVVPFDQLRTGEAATVDVYRGSGRASREAAYGVGPDGPYDTPILGDGRYYSDDREFAEHFGPNVEQVRVTLRNPLVVDTDVAWSQLSRAAGWPYANLFGLRKAQVAKHIQRMHALIRERGHDAVVVRLDQSGENDDTRTLENVFGGNTVYMLPVTATETGRLFERGPGYGEQGRNEVQYWSGTKGRKDHLTAELRGELSTQTLAQLGGVKGETRGAHRNRQGEKWDAFLADIRENGIRQPIFITVEPDGTARVSEGNHRLDAAIELGFDHVPVHVRYFGRGENRGPLARPNPKLLRRRAQQGPGGERKLRTEQDRFIDDALRDFGSEPDEGGAVRERRRGYWPYQETPHQVLGVASNASAQELKQAFYRLAKQHHPDVNKSPGATERMQKIVLAYEHARAGLTPTTRTQPQPQQQQPQQQQQPMTGDAVQARLQQILGDWYAPSHRGFEDEPRGITFAQQGAISELYSQATSAGRARILSHLERLGAYSESVADSHWSTWAGLYEALSGQQMPWRGNPRGGASRERGPGYGEVQPWREIEGGWEMDTPDGLRRTVTQKPAERFAKYVPGTHPRPDEPQLPDEPWYGFMETKDRRVIYANAFATRDAALVALGADLKDWAAPFLDRRQGDNRVNERGPGYGDAPPTPQWYSRLQRAIETAPQAKAIGKAWLERTTTTNSKGEEQVVWRGLLTKARDGISMTEADWTGVISFLEQNANRSVTREQLLKVARANAIEVTESVRDEESDESAIIAEAEAEYGIAGEAEAATSARLNHLMYARGSSPLDLHDFRDFINDEYDTDTAENLVQRAIADGLLDEQDVLTHRINTADELHRAATYWVEALQQYQKALERRDFLSQLEDEDRPQPGFATYQLPGEATDYREILLLLKRGPTPAPGKLPSGYRVELRDVGGREPEWVVVYPNGTPVRIGGDRDWTQEKAEAEAARQVAGPRAAGLTSDDFISPHSDFHERNIVVHIRLNERTINGKRVLFVEEIQSDWAHEGHESGWRDHGYGARQQRIIEIHRRSAEVITKRNAIKDALARGDSFAASASAEYADIVDEHRGMTREQAIKATAALDREYSALSAEALQLREQQRGVPDMPFKQYGEWAGLAWRRILQEAADGDFDAISWTTGEQQTERYDLSKHVSRIDYFASTNYLRAYDARGSAVADERVAPEDLKKWVGPEVAARLLASPVQDGRHMLLGEDLMVGGAWLKELYDVILPRVLKDEVHALGMKLNVQIKPLGTTGEKPAGDVVNRSERFSRRFASEEEARAFIDEQNAAPVRAVVGPYGWEVVDQHGAVYGVYPAASAEDALRIAREIGPTDAATTSYTGLRWVPDREPFADNRMLELPRALLQKVGTEPLRVMEPGADYGDLFGGEQEKPAEQQGEALPDEPMQGLTEAVKQARATVSLLEGKVKRGAATGAEQKQYRDAIALIRRNEKIGAGETVTPREDQPEPPKDLPGQQGLFGTSEKRAKKLTRQQFGRAGRPLVRDIEELTALAIQFAPEFHKWFDRYHVLLKQMFGHDADMFHKFLLVTSQNNTVLGNIPQAMRAYRQWKRHRPFKGFLPAVIRNLQRVSRGEVPGGRKISEFYRSGMGDEYAVVVDTHIAQLLFGLPQLTQGQHRRAQEVIRAIAADIGLPPRTVMAALWAANQVLKGTHPSKVMDYAKALKRYAPEIKELRALRTGATIRPARGGPTGLRSTVVDTGRDSGSVRERRPGDALTPEGGQEEAADGDVSAPVTYSLAPDPAHADEHDRATFGSTAAARAVVREMLRTAPDFVKVTVNGVLTTASRVSLLRATRSVRAWVPLLGHKLSSDPRTMANQLQQLLQAARSPKAERNHLIGLDVDGRVVYQTFMASGVIDMAEVGSGATLKRLAEAAKAAGATSLLMAHNHPSGEVVPSTDDESVAAHGQAIAQDLGLEWRGSYVIDHTTGTLIRPLANLVVTSRDADGLPTSITGVVSPLITGRVDPALVSAIDWTQDVGPALKMPSDVLSFVAGLQQQGGFHIVIANTQNRVIAVDHYPMSALADMATWLPKLMRRLRGRYVFLAAKGQDYHAIATHVRNEALNTTYVVDIVNPETGGSEALDHGMVPATSAPAGPTMRRTRVRTFDATGRGRATLQHLEQGGTLSEKGPGYGEQEEGAGDEARDEGVQAGRDDGDEASAPDVRPAEGSGAEAAAEAGEVSPRKARRDVVATPATPEDMPVAAGIARPADPISGMAASPAQQKIAHSLAGSLVTPPAPQRGRPVSAPQVIHSYARITAAAYAATGRPGRAPVPIRVGRLGNRWALGVFKVRPEVIRTLQANDIPTAAHEVAHALEKIVFGWPKGGPWRTTVGKQAWKELVTLGKQLYGSRKPAGGYAREGFAEFVRMWLTEDGTAQAQLPAFAHWFETKFLGSKKLRDVAKAVAVARNLTDRFRQQGSFTRGVVGIVDPASPRARAARAATAVTDLLSVENLIDVAEPLHKLALRAEESLGRALAVEDDPYVTATALRLTHTARARYMVENGMIDLAGNPVGPSLQNAMMFVQGQRVEFMVYLWARRTIALANDPRGPRASGLSPEDAAQIIKELETPYFQLAASAVYEWNEGVLNYAAQASPSFAELVKKVRARDPGSYIPLLREFEDMDAIWAGVMAGTTAASRSTVVKRLKGSGRRIKDPFQSMIAKADAVIRAAHHRVVIEQVIRLLNVEGVGDLIEELEPGKRPILQTTIEELLDVLDKKVRAQTGGVGGAGGMAGVAVVGPMASAVDLSDSITFFTTAQPHNKPDELIVPIVQQGVIRWFIVKAPLYRILMGMDVYRLPKLLDLVLGSSARGFRAGTTGVRASFGLVWNPIRDIPTFYVNTMTHANPAQLFGAWVTSFTEAALHRTVGRESAWIDAWLRLGGEMAQPLGQDIPHTRRAARRLFQGRVVRTLDPRNALDFYRDLVQFPESAPRLAELRLLAKEIGWTPGTTMTFAQSMQLLLASKQVTTDFSAAGRLMRVINQVEPFSNVAIQGPRSTIRALTRKQGALGIPTPPGKNITAMQRKQAAWRMQAGWRVLQMLAASLVAYWPHKDKEWYNALDYKDRFTFWHFPFTRSNGQKELLRIPRPFEIGTTVAIGEAMFHAWYKKDPESATEWFHTFVDVLNPIEFEKVIGVPVPIVTVPGRVVAEQLANREFFFDRPIVTEALSNKPNAEQANEYTSKAAILLGEIFDQSPLRIDHAIRGLYGPVSGDLLSLLGLGPAGVEREKELADAPLVGRLFQRGGQFGTRPHEVDELYSVVQDAQLLQHSDRHEESEEQRDARLQLEDATKAISALLYVRAHTDGVNDRRRITEYTATLSREALAAHAAGEIDRESFAQERQAAEADKAEIKELVQSRQRQRQLAREQRPRLWPFGHQREGAAAPQQQVDSAELDAYIERQLRTPTPRR